MTFLPEEKRDPLDGGVEQILRQAVIVKGAKIEKTLLEHGIVVNVKKIDESYTREDIEEMLRAYETGIERLESMGGTQVGRVVKKLSASVKKIRSLAESVEKLTKAHGTLGRRWGP